MFSEIEDFQNNYLEYYSQTAIIRQIKYITNFYKSFNGNLEREYPYLTEEELAELARQQALNNSIG